MIVVVREETLRLHVERALRGTPWAGGVAVAASVGEVEELLAAAVTPAAFIVGPALGLQGAGEIVAAASHLRSPPPVLLVAQPTTEVLRGSMRAGVREVLSPGFDPAVLVTALESAGVRTGGPTALPGLTVAVFSTKGGVGTSVVASNLAVRLGVRSGRRTTLVDLDLASADQSIMHGIAPAWTVQDVADGAVGLDVESLQQVLKDVPGTGGRTRLLPGPVDPALAETITSSNVTDVIAAARAESPLVVLDTSTSFDDRTLAALDAADAVVVVSSLDVAALRSLTVSLQTLGRIGVDADQISIAIVRADSKSGLVLADVKRAIGRDIDVGVPSTRTVPRSVNEGVPLAVSSPRSAVVKAIDQLADLVLRHGPAEFGEGTEPGEGDGGAAGGSGRRRPQPRSARDEPTSDQPPAAPSVPAATGTAAEDSDDDGGDPTARKGPIQRSRAADPAPRRVITRRSGRRVMTGHESDEGGGEVVEVEFDESARASERARRPKQADDTDQSLAALPPPVVARDDDDDEQPRRWRRR